MALLSCAALVALVSARALLDARACRARAERLLRANDVDGATVELRRAGRSHALFNPYATGALDALERLATDARMRGELARALSQLRAVHAAVQAARSFYPPDTERLERVDRAIGSLMAAEQAPEIDTGQTPAERGRSYASALVATRPHELWVATALFGFGLWVSGAVMFMVYGLDAEGRLVRHFATRSGISVLVGWVAFALGLHLA